MNEAPPAAGGTRRSWCLPALGCGSLALLLVAFVGAGALWLRGRVAAPAPDLASSPADVASAPSGPSGPSEDDAAARREAEGEGEAAAPGAPRSGGTLRLPGAEPATLDPAVVRDVTSATYMYEIYSGLVNLDEDLAVVPDLAESWEIGEDGRVYTFTLRADARFHDGRPVEAEDLRFSIERACDPDTASDVAATYLDDIVGCVDKLSGRADSVAGIQTPDPRTVVLRLAEPRAYFLAKLTYPTSFVLDREQVASDPRWRRRPNGTGPFRLAGFEPEERIELERHEGYHREPALLDAVHFDLRPIDPLTRFENGELDAAPVGIGDRERVRDPLNPLSRLLVEGPGDLGLSYLGLNVDRPPFDDVAVRRAFAMAVDRARLDEVVMRDAVTPVRTILPPGMPGFDPEANPLPFDPEAARAELARSRYGGPDGLPPITLHASGGGGGSPAVRAFADLVGETLGVEVAIEQAPWEVFQRELSEGEYQAWFLGWSADYPDPQNFLDVLFHSRSALNHTGYADPEVDAWLEEARTETDELRRLALYRQAEERILADAPWIPLYTGVDAWLVPPWLHGFSLPPLVVPRLGRIWLDPAARGLGTD